MGDVLLEGKSAGISTPGTLETRHTVNVFEFFQPKLSPGSRDCDVLFFREHPAGAPTRTCESSAPPRGFVALDSMNLWIEVARDALLEVIRRVDLRDPHDAELRELTGRGNLLAAGNECSAGARRSSWPSRASTAPC